MSAEDNLDRLYQQRFPEAALAEKNAIWQVLCEDFFQRFVNTGDTVGLQLAGFSPTLVYPRFLAYTSKSRMPKAAVLARRHLRFPPICRLLGKQAPVVATRPLPG